MNLKQRLEYHYNAYNKDCLSPDPMEFLHNYNDEVDIEAAGIISSVFAYGNVTAIKKTLTDIYNITGRPGYYIRNASAKEISSSMKSIFYRFYSAEDIISFFKAMKSFYKEYTSVKGFFYENYIPVEDNLRTPMMLFSEKMSHFLIKNRGEETNGIKFMFPSPLTGSACKRMNLFLRWMVRKDEIDFGLWKKIPPSKLLIPVDTHIARICRSLKLTSLKNPGWSMAEEITNNLRKFSPDDPVKYDFAICHIGIRKQSF